jgi:hypothetical protein
MASYTINVNGTSAQSSAINSTKVRVTANANAVLYTVGSNPVAGSGFANTEMIAGGTTRYVNMQGTGNKIAFVMANLPAIVTVTEVGSVDGTRTTY